MKKKEDNIIRVFKQLQNNLTMSEEGSHVTWNKPLLGRIIINKWYVWFAAVPVCTPSLERLLVLNTSRWLH